MLDCGLEYFVLGSGDLQGAALFTGILATVD
jgi:hypothetical protein